MSEVVLYDYWRSSASYRVRIALNLADIAYRAVSVDLAAGSQRTADHLARNPQGLVPVLEIDGMRLTQSLSILEYLNDTRGLGLLPDDPAARAKARALAYSVAVDLHPVCNLSVARHAAGLSAAPDDEMGQWMKHFIRPGLLAVEALLSEFPAMPYCCGDRPGLADLCLIPQLYNARRYEVDLSGLDRALAVEQVCATDPGFAAAHPDRLQPG